jgi:predicted ATP-dependent serine protease
MEAKKLNPEATQQAKILQKLERPEPANQQDKLKSRIIDLSENYPDIEYLFERNEQGCFSIGDIQAIKGKAKSGKSTFMISLLATLIAGENMGFKALKTGCNSMYIDTEQNPRNTAILAKKVHSVCLLSTRENNERFTAINLRGDTPKDRKHLINEAVQKYRPDFLIIDGIKDIIEGGDINAPTESTEAVQFLMTLTREFNLSVLTVLHENKNDQNMRGHVGTELLNKCSEIWQIKKIDNTFEAEQVENRNYSPNIIFCFEFGEDKLPVLVDSKPKESVKDRNLRLKHEHFKKCLPPIISKEYKNLANDYKEVAGVALKTACNHISEIIKSGYLFKDPSKNEYKYEYLKEPRF